MKATAVAHPIQGLIKYHGLKNVNLRIPFHDSISVCIEALHTKTTVQLVESSSEDLVVINREKVVGTDLARVEAVLNQLRDMTDYSGYFKVVSQNSTTSGKGLGFSASGFAALGTAACSSLGFDIDYLSLSKLVRIGAGSATRSLAGSFAIWYANREGKSYAEQIVEPTAVDLGMVIVPVPSSIRTDDAHNEVLTSPLFKARLRYVASSIKTMKEAIEAGDVATIGRLAEEDSLNLHASTMTGETHMVIWEPKTLRTIRAVQKMRREGVPVWYSIDTGPSVFVNTFADSVKIVVETLHEMGNSNILTSRVGSKPFLTSKHLF
jgi:phosphomevalonate decarboxylase